MSTEERIKELEEELHKTVYNKATQRHIGLLKARIAKLKEQSEKKSGGKTSGPGFSVKKSGDATVMIVGFPSVGKSTLLNALTNADSEVNSYEFTTVDVIPGMMDYKGVKIQLLDVPGIIKGASKGKGMGRQILSVVRNADLVVIMLDKEGQLDHVEQELYAVGIRLNKRPPNVKIIKKSDGGVQINPAVKYRKETLGFFRDLVREYGITNAEVIIRERITSDELIDVLANNRMYVPAVVVMNKSDVNSRIDGVDLLISAKKKEGLKELRDLIFDRLEIARVFMKKIGEKPDLEEPLVLKGDKTIEGICKQLHKDFLNNFRYARVWGESAKFDGQQVGLEHEVLDGDIVELHLRR